MGSRTCDMSYVPPKTSEHTPALAPASDGWYSIYLPQRDGRLSWPGLSVSSRDEGQGRSGVVWNSTYLAASNFSAQWLLDVSVPLKLYYLLKLQYFV